MRTIVASFVYLCLAVPALGEAVTLRQTGFDHANAAPDSSVLSIIDEIRFGVTASIQSSSPEGLLVNGQVLFVPFVGPFKSDLLDVLCGRARISG